MDSEFLEYWSKLSDEEKKTVLFAVKNYIESKQGEDLHSEIRKNLILEEREAYIKGKGVSFSWEDVKEMARDKTSRDGL